MSAHIENKIDHVRGEYTVKVNLGGKHYENFTSMMDASKWLDLMKASSKGEIEAIYVTLLDIIITAKQQSSYKTCYVY